MGARMAKPAIDVGIVTTEAEPLLAYYRGVFGFESMPQTPR